MDYIYGSLNEDVEQVEYYGVNTDTANTTIKQEDRTIKVDVKKVPNTLTITNGNNEIVYDGSSSQSINIDSGSDYSAGEGITISDNTISIDSETVATKEDVESVRTYKTFNDSWVKTSSTLAFCQSIEEDDTAPEGTAYLGTLGCSDLPNDMGQAEATVEIISNGANGKCIDITLTSLEVSPYRWTYSYGRVNGDVVTVGWKGSQEELVSGTNIKTINGSSILGSGDLTISAGLTLYNHSIDVISFQVEHMYINLISLDSTPLNSYEDFRTYLINNLNRVLKTTISFVNGGALPDKYDASWTIKNGGDGEIYGVFAMDAQNYNINMSMIPLSAYSSSSHKYTDTVTTL